MDSVFSFCLQILKKMRGGKYIIGIIIGLFLCGYIYQSIFMPFKDLTIARLEGENQSLKSENSKIKKASAICDAYRSAVLLQPTWIGNHNENFQVASGQILITANVHPNDVDFAIHAGDEAKEDLDIQQGERKTFKFDNNEIFIDVLKIDVASLTAEITISKKVPFNL